MPDSLTQFFRSTEMYVHEVNFDTAAAFLQGYNVACGGRVLLGFREWLILRLGDGNNLAWTELFLRFAFPDSVGPRMECLPTADPERVVGLLGEVFSKYWVEREEIGGLQNIMEQHTVWLKAQDWYQEAKQKS